MKPTKARMILHALTQGLDPETGAELPERAITFRTDIFRALHAAVDVLDQADARAKRRAQLPSGVGRPWTPEEEQQLATEFGGDEPVDRIAERHSRTVRAIEARLERLGLITADQRSTTNSFTGPPTPKKGAPS